MTGAFFTLQAEHSNSNRILTLDCVRLLAMALVAFQHILSVCGYTSPKVFFDLDIGQVGVAIFFAISGFLAVHGKESTAISWLKKRLTRIYIPYWIAVTGVFVANSLTGYKPASPSLIISEYLGLAGWTHHGEIIGVHFWFVSLLLFCYVIAALLRRIPGLFPIVTVLVVAWLWHDAHYAGHVLAFLTGMFIEKANIASTFLGLMSCLATILAHFLNAGFACIAVASLSLLVCRVPLVASNPISDRIRAASNLSYHFYLVHGPIYLAVSRFLSEDLAFVFCVGTSVSVVCSLVLQKMEAIVRSIRWKYKWMPTGSP